MDVEKVRLKRMLGLTADILALAWVKPDRCSCRIDVPGLCASCAEREATLAMIRDASRMTEEEEAAYAECCGKLVVTGPTWDAAVRDALVMLGGLNDPPGRDPQLP